MWVQYQPTTQLRMTSAVPKLTKANNAIQPVALRRTIHRRPQMPVVLFVGPPPQLVQPALPANTSHRSRAYCHAENATGAGLGSMDTTTDRRQNSCRGRTGPGGYVQKRKTRQQLANEDVSRSPRSVAADPDKAARRLMEPRAFEPAQDGRICIEKINRPFLFNEKGHSRQSPWLAVSRPSILPKITSDRTFICKRLRFATAMSPIACNHQLLSCGNFSDVRVDQRDNGPVRGGNCRHPGEGKIHRQACLV